MVRLLKQMMSSEKGQALPIVLALMVFGALVITPSLGYISTSLNSSRVIRDDVKGIYAADAGVEDILWSLDNGMFFPDKHLPEFINQMMVDTQTEETGTYTLYFGEMIEPADHFDYLDVDGEMVWDDGAQAYKYIITVTWLPASGYPVIHLDEVGARLPLGYSYQPESAASFEENLSTDEPDETLDALGAYLLNWEVGSPKPYVSENETVRTQTFYTAGEGSQEDHYAWVVANREDIGAVGEITGTSYQIKATARRYEDGETTAKIVANVMIEEDTTHILSWQILN